MDQQGEAAATAAEIEYESFVFSRHLAGLPGRSRRSTGVLDQSAYSLLTLLELQGPQSIGELSGVTGLDASTLNRQTSALMRSGYAERIADPAGGIARKFRLTPVGHTALHEERDATRVSMGRLVETWTPADREQFAALLGRFNREIEARSGRRWPRPEGTDITPA